MIENCDSIVRERGRIVLNDLRQEMYARSRHASNGDIAAAGFTRFRDLREGVRQFAHQASGLRQEIAAGGSQGDAARGAFNQLDPQVRLKILQAAGDGGLRDVQLVSRLLKAT